MFSELIKTTKGNIVIGGDYDEKSCYIAPTVIENVLPGDSTMQDEIFGPILPMLDCNSLGENMFHYTLSPMFAQKALHITSMIAL